MKGLSFLSRFAFICNLLFVVCLIIRLSGSFEDNNAVGAVGGTVIVLGWFIAPVINIAVNLSYAYYWMRKKPLPLSRWLAITNVFFLLVQLFIHLILPA